MRLPPSPPRTRPMKPSPVTPMPYAGSTAYPFLKWVGGKRRVLPQIMDKAPHTWERYHEPFLGGGALFFSLAAQRPRPAGWAFISDQNERLVRTFRAVRDSVEELILCLEQHAALHDKTHYYEVRSWDIDPQSDVALAAWMIYLNKTGFNGLYRVNRQGRFNVPMGRYKNPAICDAANLRACAAALQGVEILHEGFDAVLERATGGDFVYFDPPYVPASKTASFTSYTADGFTLDDQERLRDVARILKDSDVSIMLSNSDVPRVRKLYTPGFRKHTIQVSRAINCQSDKRGTVGELIIC
jgi:DNA adenine methylase